MVGVQSRRQKGGSDNGDDALKAQEFGWEVKMVREREHGRLAQPRTDGGLMDDRAQD